MTDSERFTADVAEALLQAACYATDGAVPQAAAARAMRWLRNDCDRGRGVKPGWGGQDTHLLSDRDAEEAMRERIAGMKATGEYTVVQIAADVNRTPRRVHQILAEMEGVKASP